MKRGNSWGSAGLFRGGVLLLALAITLGTAGACGDDTSPETGDAGVTSMVTDDAGGGEVTPDAGDAGGNDAAVVSMTECDDGEQDRDGDGVCKAACSDALECGAGSCDDFSGTATCACPDGVAGEACDECAQGFAGATCEDCADGFVAAGDSCIEDACADLACGDHGSCVQDGSEAGCDCAQGFAGDLCDTCATGYTGAACDSCDVGFALQDGACVSDVCLGHFCGSWGHCIDDGGAPKCECNEGNTGDICEECEPGYSASLESSECKLRPPPALQSDLLLWQDADDRTALIFSDKGVLIGWRNKGSDKTSFAFPGAHAPTVTDDGERMRVAFTGGDYGSRTFSLTSGAYSVYIVAKWQSDADAGGNAPSQGILAGTDFAGTLGHGLWYEARSDNEIRYRHRFPFGGGGAAVGDEVYGALYDANEGLQVISSQRGTAAGGYIACTTATTCPSSIPSPRPHSPTRCACTWASTARAAQVVSKVRSPRSSSTRRRTRVAIAKRSRLVPAREVGCRGSAGADAVVGSVSSEIGLFIQ